MNTKPLPRTGSGRLQFLLEALGFIFIAGFACRYANARIYADAAYFLMHVADSGTFHVINGRWIIVLTQWLPVLGTWLHLPMPALITLFSIGNVVLLAASYVFVTFRLKDRVAGIALIAVQFVGLSHALFCPIFEFYYGALLLVVFWSVLRTDALSSILRLTLLSVLFVLVISSHFMGLLVMALMLILERLWRDRRLTLLLSALLIGQLFIRLFFLTAYEANAFTSIGIRLDLLGIGWALVPGRLWAQFVHAVHHYPDTLLFALLATVALIRQRDGWGLFVHIGGLSIIYLLTSLYLPDATQSYYREIVDYPATVWVIIVLTARVLPNTRWMLPFLLLLIVALGFRVWRTSQVAEAHVARVAWMEERIRAAHVQGIRRGFITEAPEFLPPGHGVAKLTTISPMEVLLLSAREDPDRVVVLLPLLHSNKDLDTVELDSSLAVEGIEFPTSPNGVYLHMPSGPFQVVR